MGFPFYDYLALWLPQIVQVGRLTSQAAFSIWQSRQFFIYFCPPFQLLIHLAPMV
jgi:hypothetical protein